MTSSSHLASAALCYLGASALLETSVSIEGVAVTAFGSLLPDIDTPTSSIGRPFFPLARWIDKKVGHRTLTHSLVGMAGFYVLVAGLAWLCSKFWTALPSWNSAGLLTLGYASHVLVDTLNKTGVELFWPSRLRCVFFYNEKYRIAAAGRGDYWFMSICLILNLAMYPLAREGFTRSLHRAFGDIYSVSMDFKQYGDKNQIWLELEGVEAISNQKVQGRFEILAAMDNASVLVERDGIKQIVSRTEPLQIFPSSARISVGQLQHITTDQINMAGRTLGEVPRFPGASRVLLYGYLTPAKHSPLSVHVDRYDPISLRLDKLKLEHAEYADIRDQNLDHVLIREGMLTARVYRSGVDDASVSAIEPGLEPIRHVEIRLRPSDQILFKVGDVVREGQVIGRQDITLEMDKLTVECRQDIERLNAELDAVSTRLTSARAELRRAEDKVLEVESDVERLKTEPLLAKDHSRLSRSLDNWKSEAVSEREKIRVLERRATEIQREIVARSERFSGEVAALEKRARIVASFSGSIVRIEREASDQMVVASVFYRPWLIK